MAKLYKGIYNANHLMPDDQKKHILHGKKFNNLDLTFLKADSDGLFEIITECDEDKNIVVTGGMVKLICRFGSVNISSDNNFLTTGEEIEIIVFHDRIVVRNHKDTITLKALYLNVDKDDKIYPGATIAVPAKFFGLDIEGVFEITL